MEFYLTEEALHSHSLAVKFRRAKAKGILTWIRKQIEQRCATDTSDLATFVFTIKSTIANSCNISKDDIPVGIQMFLIDNLVTSEEAVDELREYTEYPLIHKLAEVRYELHKRQHKGFQEIQRLMSKIGQSEIKDWLINDKEI